MAEGNLMNYNPTPFTSIEQVLAQRQPYTEGMILSPNVEFVPDPPVHRKGNPFTFFSDGMLGPFKYLKWPQVFDEQEPHAIATPGNPNLMFNVKFQELPLLDYKGALPHLSDQVIPWEPLWDTNFTVALHLPMEDVGFIIPALHTRLRSAANEAIVLAMKVVDTQLAAMFAHRNDREEYTECRKNYVLRYINMLRRAISRLQETPMPFFNVVLWFQDTQRLILALRTWLTYITVIKP